MAISREEVITIAELAKLTLSEAEIEMLNMPERELNPSPGSMAS